MHDFLFQEKRASDADLDAPNKLESDAKLASKIHIFAGGRGGGRGADVDSRNTSVHGSLREAEPCMRREYVVRF